MPSPDHKETVRQEFTQQAQAYAVNPVVTDPARLSQLVETVRPAPDARVLDVATGPGFVAMAFAEAGCEVVGLDLTAAPLAIAEQTRQQRGLTRLSFQVGDAERIPFDADTFDIVVSRLALHHWEHPQSVLKEMARVCRAGGLVVIEDLVVSAFPSRADYQNHFERLRDPSHTQALPIRELLDLLTGCGLEVEQISTDFLLQNVEQWLANSHTPPEQATQVRALIKQDEQDDLSGTHPFRQQGNLYFRQRMATLVSRKLV